MKIKNSLLIPIVIIGFLSSCSNAKKSEDQDKGLIILENIEWTNQWVENTGDKSLPRLLLIGDSHVQQYYGFVKEKLKGKFNFGRYTTSKCLGNPFLAKEIKTFLQQYPCDVIVFNNGLHGSEYPDSVYAAAIPEIFNIFKEVQPKAKVIWVNTTPRRKSKNLQEFTSGIIHVQARNKYASVFMKQHNIPIVDSYTLEYEHPEYYLNDGVHFNPK